MYNVLLGATEVPRTRNTVIIIIDEHSSGGKIL